MTHNENIKINTRWINWRENIYNEKACGGGIAWTINCGSKQEICIETVLIVSSSRVSQGMFVRDINEQNPTFW